MKRYFKKIEDISKPRFKLGFESPSGTCSIPFQKVLKWAVVKKIFLTILLLLVSIYLYTFLESSVFAQSSVTPPSFPSCQEKIFEKPGDWSHYDFGSHEILGIGRRNGRDDVYSLNSGNFLQCFCPVEGSDGIQTDWWNVQRRGLTDEEINGFVNEGWVLIDNASGWNLFAEKYLAKNRNFSCAQPSPTPSPTVTPTITPTVTPTPIPTATVTPTPTLTPTPGPEPENPRCVGLSASPTEGSAPLTVKFTGSGFDKNGPILEYEFDFGDASGFQPQIWKQKESEAAHRYENPGTFVASVKVKDQGGTWRDGGGDCRKTIVVRGRPQVLTASTPSQLPAAGAPVLAVFSLVPLGYYLYKRFKLY